MRYLRAKCFTAKQNDSPHKFSLCKNKRSRARVDSISNRNAIKRVFEMLKFDNDFELVRFELKIII